MSLTIRSQRNKKNNRSGAQSGLDQLHKDMKDLMELQKAQEIRFVPEVADVPRIRFKADQLHNVELSYAGTFNTSTAGPTYGALQFMLNQASNYASYTGAFDQYRVIQINVKFLPGAAGASAGVPFLSVIDYDDATLATSQATYFAYSTLKITPLGQIDERTLVPKIATAAYQGSVFSAYTNTSSATFIDSASPSVAYYGLKYYVPQTTVALTTTYIVTMMVQFKSQRST